MAKSKSYRKFIATSATATLVATAVAPSAFAAADFTDISKLPQKEQDAIKALADAKILEGKKAGAFDPYAGMKRAEVAKVLAEIRGLGESTKDAGFKDTKGHWAEKYINAAAEAGLVEGKGEGKFDPEGTVKRSEFAAMVVRAYGLKLKEGSSNKFTDIPANYWGKEAIEILYSHGLINGKSETKFAPEEKIQRNHVALLVYNTDADHGDVIKKPEEPVDEVKVESVSAINDTTLTVTFNQAIENADDIEEDGNRVVVYNAVQSHTAPTATSTVVTFSEDKKSATVFLGASLATGQKYKVALLDDNRTPALAKVVAETDFIELIKGIDVPEVSPADGQDEFTLKFAKKMNAAAEVSTNYTVYDSSNNAVVGAIASAAFVSGSDDKEVTLTVDPGALQAGKTYTVIVNNTNVEADDGTKLTAAQSKFTIKTPTVAEAKPKLVSAQVTGDDEIVLTFDRDLKTNPTVDTDLVSVKNANGTSVSVNSAAISGETLTITSPASSFEAGKAYKVDVAANVGINNVYRNATTDAISTTAVAAENKPATGMTAKIVRDADDKEKFDLILTFDQPVNEIASTTQGDLTINALGKSYEIDGSVNVEKYTKDATGKSLIVKDAAAKFNTAGGDALEVKPGTTYEVVATTGVIETTTPAAAPETNKKDLKASFTGIDVSAPEVEEVTLASAEKITVKFDETIDVSDLKAGDITVKGFVKALDGSADQKTLTGANQLKFSASGDTLTITPANASVKFATGEFGGTAVTDFITIADEVIQDKNGIVNAAAYEIDSNDAEVTDLASPIIISAKSTATGTLVVTYSEDADFKATSGNDEAKQFDVKGVKVNQVASAASFTNNALTLTFTGSFEANKDYSAATLVYTRNVNYQVEDAEGNRAANASFVGFNNGI